ncbi:phosphoribulokinase/uridine kinase family protein [Psychromonas ingrahamii 37]|uniref:Phosphoribulokinase/uridine kinase family protein n=1 Tax=Psychromonas ingrahamii (strain DSM 17664 / CCUG 51855 / 37) TaxID=357804 RepID=A1SYE5_PSYIN|nr:AAA family ATPase [Psychromonas ingrahamii]ABM04510.1 phosphoribulokinase/uridine kinase family protein [Psychromonas ingrahamii 37]
MKDYDQLADQLRDKSLKLRAGAQYWIALAGAPGSGKSTLAEALKSRLGELLTIIPMDGFHYYRHELDKMNDPAEAYARRGAPFTFNAPKFVNAVIKARQEGEGLFPGFDHNSGDPVENDISLNKDSKIVLIEGNYLLLDEKPWSQLQNKVFDETWFLYVPLPECNRRVCARHMKTGLTKQQAQHRVASNDSLNAQLVTEVSIKNAQRIIRIN